MRCARDECDNTELTTKTATLRARSHVQVVLRVDSLDLGFHVVIGVGRLNVQPDGFIRQLHITTQTQHQMQSFFLHRPLNLYLKFLHISHRKNGSFEVLSLHLSTTLFSLLVPAASLKLLLSPWYLSRFNFLKLPKSLLLLLISDIFENLFLELDLV